MAPAPSQWHLTLLDILADGDWHPYREVNERLGSLIAPGRALRHYESKEQRRREYEGPRKFRPLSEEQKIATGRRILAGIQIHRARDRYVQIEDRADRSRWIRRHPQYAQLPQAAGVPDEDFGDDVEAGPVQPAPPPAPTLPPGADDVAGVLPPHPPLPSCVDCGAMVIDGPLHEAWHERQPVSREEMAMMLRQFQAGVQAAMARQLDAFRAGQRAS